MIVYIQINHKKRLIELREINTNIQVDICITYNVYTLSESIISAMVLFVLVEISARLYTIRL